MSRPSMKYRVKFKCYHYNTGWGDNHAYTKRLEFDTIELAEAFRIRVNEQYRLQEAQRRNSTSYSEWLAWKAWHSDDSKLIEIEDGYILGEAEIVRFFPEREEQLDSDS